MLGQGGNQIYIFPSPLKGCSISFLTPIGTAFEVKQTSLLSFLHLPFHVCAHLFCCRSLISNSLTFPI